MLNLDKSKKYLLACSFGPDSMALFHMLKNNEFCFDVAIVNYHLRNESDFEVNSLQEYCNQNNVKLYIFNVTEKITKNIEEKAREIRYSFFNKLYKQNGYSALLVAHNNDDHIETYLLQKKRKNLPLYYGIAVNTCGYGMNIIRPLLDYKKSDLLDYVNKNCVPYAIDLSNFEDNFERNKIRHEIVEKLSTENRNMILEEIKEKNDNLILLLNGISKVPNYDIDNINKMSDLEFAYFITLFIRKYIPNYEIGFSYSKEIHKAIKSNKPNIVIKLDNSYELLRDANGISVVKQNNQYYSFVYEKPSKDNNQYFYMDFTLGSANRNVKPEDYPITIRTALPNDVVTIKGYEKEIRRLMIDWKVPLSLRKRWCVILSKDNTVIYCPRYKKGFIPDSDCNFYLK